MGRIFAVKTNILRWILSQIESCSNKVCISFKTKNKNIEDPNDEYDLKIDKIGNDLSG